jgi:hypothetical protein
MHGQQNAKFYVPSMESIIPLNAVQYVPQPVNLVKVWSSTDTV